MKRILLALALLALGITPALAQTGTPKTKAALNTEIDSQFPNNTTGAITPTILRQVTKDMVASWQQYGGVNAQTVASYTIALSDYGQLVTVTNAGAIAITLPQATGSFQTFSFFFQNIGATTATITPITSTINGAANLSVSGGAAFYIVSDGTNWRAVANSGGGGGGGTPTLPHTHIFVGNGTNNAADFGGQFTIADNGAVSISPSTGAALTITTTGATQNAITTNSTTNYGSGGPYSQTANLFQQTDSSTSHLSAVSALTGEYRATAAADLGNGYGVFGQADMLANTGWFYGVGVGGICFGDKTATGPTGNGGAGQCAGAIFQSVLRTGGNGFMSNFGIETDIGTQAGVITPPKQEVAYTASHVSSATQRASLYEAAFSCTDFGGSSALGWDYCYGIADNQSGQPISTTTTIMGYKTLNALATPTAKSIFDFAGVNCNTNILVVGTVLTLDCTGSLTKFGALNGAAGGVWSWSTRSALSSQADSQIKLTNNGGTSFNLLNFGPASASFPALKVSGIGLRVRSGDDLGDAAIIAGVVNAAGSGGFQWNGAAPTAHYLRGNGSNYVDASAATVAADLNGTGAASLQKQVFSASGTFTIPANTTAATVFKFTITGAGGGGGGASTAAPAVGAGGGAGCTAIKWLSALTGGNTITVTVGTAGTAGASTGGNGGAGGNSSIASGTQTITTVTANGGAGGTGANTSVGTAGGLGGACTNADVPSPGGDGHGGGGQNPNAFWGGQGGGSSWGGGGQAPIEAGGVGQPGRAIGAGGGGASTSGGANAGGAGAGAQVLAEWVL